MPQTKQSTDFNLTDALAGDVKGLPHFFKSGVFPTTESKTHPHDFFLTLWEIIQYELQGLA
jgi:hypothetical protein